MSSIKDKIMIKGSKAAFSETRTCRSGKLEEQSANEGLARLLSREGKDVQCGLID